MGEAEQTRLGLAGLNSCDRLWSVGTVSGFVLSGVGD